MQTKQKKFAADLKTIYHTPDEQQGHDHMLKVAEKWNNKNPNAIDSLLTAVASA